ncbi:BN159_2729 family protein [Actinacidiphila alni]|uniref:BN159_2729 family protein n=1 Tax=Actinacidiphila alni TaxID=380248 RepID=UPI0033C0F3B2
MDRWWCPCEPPQARTQGAVMHKEQISAETHGEAGSAEGTEAARFWARAQARRAAAALSAAYGAHADVVSVATQGDQAVMVMQIRDLHTWYVHRDLLGIPPESVTCEADACVGRTVVVTTPVRLVGHGVPGLLAAAAGRARQPYRIGDRVYDLGVPLADGDGALWRYRGSRTPDGVPLLRPYGRDGEPRRLPDLVRRTGELCPARRPVPRLRPA